MEKALSSQALVRSLSKDGSVHVTDEFYNTLISGTAAFVFLLASIALIFLSVQAHKSLHVIAFTVYGLAVVNLFIASALHHGVDGTEELEHSLRQYDYYSISLMIAGTFTPLCLILLRNSFGWMILGIMWFLAIAGILLKMIFPHLPKWISTSVFIGMGWIGVLIAKPLYQLSPYALGLMALGGLFYTVGAVIFSIEKPNPLPGRFGFHEIWHLFVVAGAASHFAVIYLFISALP